MSTAVTTTQDFQQRMFERIRDQMGDLLTDEDLKKLVDAAVQKAFFENVKTPRSYGGGYEEGEPVLVTLLRRHLQDKVGESVQAWLNAHPEEVAKAINETISKGVTKIMQDHIDSRCNGPLWNLAHTLKEKNVLG